MVKCCCIGFFPDYEKMFFQYVESSKFHVFSYNPLEITDQIKCFSKLPRFIRNWYHKKLIKSYIKSHPDYIYIFNEHRLLLQAIQEYLKVDGDFKGHLLLRNPISKNQKIFPILDTLNSYNIEKWSFDHEDCKNHGFKLYRQFLSPLPNLSILKDKYDFSFIGRNKGRVNLLNQLKSKFNVANLSFLISLKDGSRSSNVNYEQYLEQSLSAKCIVEILQEGQTGMTLRPLEALFYNKKLLTNNLSIKNEPLYHPNNILIVDDMELVTLQEICDFMSRPIFPINKEVKELYLTEGLLLKLLKLS